MAGLIYKITNKINGKCYIGLTTRTLYRREYDYRYGHENEIHSTPIFLAFKKYGIENFTFEVVEENIPNEELDQKEKDYIKLYNTRLPDGYNATSGGRLEGTGELHNSRKKSVYRIDPMTFEIVDEADSLAEMARKMGSTAIRISEVCHRKQYTAKGFIYRFKNDYSRAEVEDFHNQKRPDTHIPVEAFYIDTNEVIGQYPSIYQASKELNISSGSISSYIEGKRNRAATINERAIGFICIKGTHQYKNEAAERIRNEKVKMKYKGDDETPVELYIVGTGEVIDSFPSISEAAKSHSIVKIRECILLKRKYYRKGISGTEYNWRVKK